MSFANASNFSIHGSTFSNVAGDQIVTHVTHIHQYRVAEVAHANMPRSSRGDVDNDEYTLPMPTTPPYSTFISTIVDIQQPLGPLDNIVLEPRLFGGLLKDFERLRHLATLAGAIVEILDDAYPKFFIKNMEKHVERYHAVLRNFKEEIARIRQGLQSSLIGSLWYRILWATSSPNIPQLVSIMIREIDGFQKPIMQFLTVHKKFALHPFRPSIKFH
ncbi:hypothetical protein HGRIS_001334 [Hohenbuehelia grisea]|uniref:Uncharacterized protein n=1 Tax=Hohenbuehelia grisea TaxID=104357 RepID=A0ABR3JQ22_9AGAR